MLRRWVSRCGGIFERPCWRPGTEQAERPWYLVVLKLVGKFLVPGGLLGFLGYWWLFPKSARAMWLHLRPWVWWGVSFGLLFLFWVFFFAQFIVPVDTVEERLALAMRVLASASGRGGPALLVQRGMITQEQGEYLCRGLGLVLTDASSAVVLRTKGNYTKIVGPNSVGFVGTLQLPRAEYVADIVDLRAVTRVVGPREDPFAPCDGEDEAACEERKRAFYETRGLTRDGVEVVPAIWVLFHVAGADEAPEPRFLGQAPAWWERYQRLAGRRDPWLSPSFRTPFYGTPQAVWRAVVSRPLDAVFRPQAPEQRWDGQRELLPWDWLPAAMAADLWRDYIERFALDQLFVPLPEHGGKTALEVIQEWIRRRLTQPYFCDLGPAGQPPEIPPEVGKDEAQRMEWCRRHGTLSQEFHELRMRGVVVRNVVIIAIHFPPDVEQRLAQFKANTWLQRAKAERDLVERLRARAQHEGEARALTALTTQLAEAVPQEVDCLAYWLHRFPHVALDPRVRQRQIRQLSEVFLRRLVHWVEQPDLRQRLGTPIVRRLRHLLHLLRREGEEGP